MKPTPDLNALWHLRDFIALVDEPSRGIDLRLHTTILGLSPDIDPEERVEMIGRPGARQEIPFYTRDPGAARDLLDKLFEGFELSIAFMTGRDAQTTMVTPYLDTEFFKQGSSTCKTETLALIRAGLDAYFKNAEIMQPPQTRPSERIKRLSNDCGFLLGMIETLEEATGEGPEDEDAALVGAIRADLEAQGQPITRPQTAIEELIAKNQHLSAILEERFNETALIEFQNGQMVLENGPVPYFAAYLAQMLTRPDGTQSNYAQMEIQHNTLGPLTLTLQRESGKTPHAMRREAELARDEVILALHDPINRPKGVVPASAEPFYDPQLAARASEIT